MVRLLLADDHAIVRVGLRQILELSTSPKFDIEESATAHQTLERATLESWDIILLDLNFSDGSGLMVIDAMKQMKKEVPILVLSVSGERSVAEHVLNLGAAGFLIKEDVLEQLTEAILSILSGKRYVSRAIASKLPTKLLMDHQLA